MKDWNTIYRIEQLQQEAGADAQSAQYFWGTAGSIARLESQATANAEITRLGGTPEYPCRVDPAAMRAEWEAREQEYAEQGGWQPR